MLTMQMFYDLLFADHNGEDNYFQSMARLAQVSLEQLDTLKSELLWYPWEASDE